MMVHIRDFSAVLCRAVASASFADSSLLADRSRSFSAISSSSFMWAGSTLTLAVFSICFPSSDYQCWYRHWVILKNPIFFYLIFVIF